MNREIRESLKNFDRVWQRVSGGAGSGEERFGTVSDEADTLRRFIADAEYGAQTYKAMAQRTKGMASKTLAAMAADERKLLGRLQMEYFLLSGDTMAPGRERQQGEGLLSQLRRCYRNEGFIQLASRSASQQTNIESLSALYREQTLLAMRHQKTLHGLIRQAIG